MEANANISRCPSDEIAAYIDGELAPARELELDLHFVQCEICSEELNQQKQFLCELDAGLKGEVALPPDFAKTIVVNAESAVAGLRRPRERFNALFICAALFLFVLFALGTGVFSGLSNVIDQVAAVGEFFGHIIYSIFLGLAIIVRSFAAQLRFDTAMASILAVTVAVLLTIVSRRLLRIRRA
jgi:hypothetical protein